eukprot:11619515-Ditylum_brightwellii.AAC.1
MIWQNRIDQTEFESVAAATLNGVHTNAMKKAFGPDELQQLQFQALGSPTTDSILATEDTDLIGENSVPDTGAANTNTTNNESQQNNIYPDLPPKYIELYDAILVAYRCFKLVPIDERPKIQHLPWTSKSRRTTSLANKAATDIAKSFNITSITDLNTLYFAVASSI